MTTPTKPKEQELEQEITKLAIQFFGEPYYHFEDQIKILVDQAIKTERNRVVEALPKKIRKQKTNGCRGWQYKKHQLPEGCETNEFATGLNYVVKLVEKALENNDK